MRTSVVISLGLLTFSLLSVHAGDRSPSPFHQSPSKKPVPVVPGVQTDDFSCGYHALSAIYRSHGLDPDLARLRERLGTSVPAIPFVEDSTGTLQPDLLRVLRQDGFFATVADPSDADDRDWLVSHLDRGLLALALIKTDRPGGLHWLVLSGHEEGRITIADSLKPAPHQVSIDDLIGGPLLSTVILQPTSPSPGSPYHMIHAQGLFQMAGTLWRAAPPLGRIFVLLIVVLTAWLAFKAIWLLKRKLLPRRR